MSDYERISVEQAQALLEQDDTALLDVRQPGAYEQGHVEGARNVGEHDVMTLVEELPKSAPVVIYCYHGNSSQFYARLFAAHGFAHVYSVDGGYEAWREAV